jgi:ribosomal-protein-alanine N-acetyltransferase
MHQQHELRTARLVMRPLVAGDAEQLHELWTTAGVRRFLWDDEVIPPARTVAAIERSQTLFRERAFGLWGAWPAQQPSTLAGFGGLWPFREPPELELLYGVAEPEWGRGYATDLAHAVVGYCFDVLGMSRVGASTDVANVASIRVLEKLGAAFVRRADVDGLDTVFYEVRQHSAKAARRSTGDSSFDRQDPAR